MNRTGLRVARAVAAALLAGACALPASALTWSFTLDAPLLLGGTLAGSFSGSDTDGDSILELGEVTGLQVDYTGAPPLTTSFGISKSLLDAGDLFSFDLPTRFLSLSVSDAGLDTIAVDSGGVQTVFGPGFVDQGSSAVQVSAIPEPSRLAMIACGITAIWYLRRRRC